MNQKRIEKASDCMTKCTSFNFFIKALCHEVIQIIWNAGFIFVGMSYYCEEENNNDIKLRWFYTRLYS